MKFVYNIGILILNLLVRLAAPFNSKVRLWVNGMKDWKTKLSNAANPGNRNIWIHCASLGEFEQGRPLIEALKKEKPDVSIILTFFSPSGYEIRKNYQQADYVCYLPADTPRNAADFISAVNPALVIFVKYEFWNNYILELSRRNIPLYLISAIFRPDQHFFKWYGTFFRKVLSRFQHFFVQDRESMELLSGIGITNVTVTGDTRFDRVARIAETAKEIHQIKQFRGEQKLFLSGSSWPGDEAIVAEYINRYPGRMKWIFAPHEIGAGNIERLEKLFTTSAVRFSQFSEKTSDARVMIIDNIGMLSSAYRYASVAEVGGGFGAGIHNILEAACWGMPVMFGPNYRKFREAVELIELGGAKSFRNYQEFSDILDNFLTDGSLYLKAAETAGQYVRINTGATSKIMAEIKQKI
ncbi:MAG: glycosyltransferase N-terminal domain-containing protein [Bacteroidota bacterium]|nr:glycosyltransferase N-terminal domain-containing protein [Bacteroidota bacterium]